MRSCTGIDRERGIARNGGYFQMEVLPAGSQFRFCVIWRGMWKDVSEAARLTETLLSALHRGEAVLGNRSALGFGRVSNGCFIKSLFP